MFILVSKAPGTRKAFHSESTDKQLPTEGCPWAGGTFPPSRGNSQQGLPAALPKSSSTTSAPAARHGSPTLPALLSPAQTPPTQLYLFRPEPRRKQRSCPAPCTRPGPPRAAPHQLRRVPRAAFRPSRTDSTGRAEPRARGERGESRPSASRPPRELPARRLLVRAASHPLRVPSILRPAAHCAGAGAFPALRQQRQRSPGATPAPRPYLHRSSRTLLGISARLVSMGKRGSSRRGGGRSAGKRRGRGRAAERRRSGGSRGQSAPTACGAAANGAGRGAGPARSGDRGRPMGGAGRGCRERAGNAARRYAGRDAEQRDRAGPGRARPGQARPIPSQRGTAAVLSPALGSSARRQGATGGGPAGAMKMRMVWGISAL